ncbi:MAG: hypothetical protein AVDCRST_MAG59-2167 [uncultured Thermomicrobiales bacterium]|uniref:Uncharacterized protein n=1 Tax=uncultured Thermomicrobiales bacterium TaxID=1645740 RepID=A0A6J4UU48_9BACT|nr:MAG: hypothetical protein AVDCRST_MAG59-2167 [uncultured Thermomicrobiales bacterium]
MVAMPRSSARRGGLCDTAAPGSRAPGSGERRGAAEATQERVMAGLRSTAALGR